MRIILLSIALLFCAFSAQSQVLKSAGVWYFLDVDSMTARPAVLPNGTELAYVVGTKTVYYWNRNTSTWTAYGSTFNRDSIYFDSSIAGSGTVGDPWRVDSTLFATIAAVGDSIAAALGYVAANYFPLEGGTLSGTTGNGFIGLPAQSSTPSASASGFRMFANGAHNLGIIDRNGWITTFDISASANRDFTYPSTGGTFALGTGILDLSARWTGTNTLVAGNLSDNTTRLQALLPWQFHSWTTAGRPTGVDGYVGRNSTTGFQEGYFTSQWENYITSTGAANGQVSIFSSAGKTYGTNNLFWDNVNTRLGVGTNSPVAKVNIASANGGANQTLALTQLANNASAGSSYISIDFNVPTTGLIGQFFGTANNYSNALLNLNANSIGLLAEAPSGQLLLGAAGSSGYISFNTAGYAPSDEKMRILSNGKVGIGTATPTGDLEVSRAFNGSAIINLINANSGSNAYSYALFRASTNSGRFGYIGKFSEAAPAFKTISAGDFFISNWGNGNIALQNDFSTGNITFSTGGVSSTQMIIVPSGRVGIAKSSPSYILDVTSTDAFGLPRGTVAQRPTIVSSTTPFRYNTDSTALEYGESVGTWRQLATRAYARSLTSSSPWLGTRLNAGDVDINANAHQLQIDSISNLLLTSQSTSQLGGAYIEQKKWINTARTKYIARGFLHDSRAGVSGGMPAFYNLLYLNNGAGDLYEWTNEMLWDTTTNSIKYGFGSKFQIGFMKFTSARASSGTIEQSTPRFQFNGTSATENENANTYHSIWQEQPGVILMGLKDGGKFLLNADSTMIFDPSIDVPQFNKMGVGNKEAADLGKAQSNYIAGFATDGTLLDLNLGTGLSLSGGSLTAQNIFNTNGTFTGSRTVDAAGYALRFNNISSLGLAASNHTSEIGNATLFQRKKLTASESKYYDAYYQYDSRSSINGTNVAPGPSYSRLFVYNLGGGEGYEWTDMHTLDTTNSVFGHMYGARYNPGLSAFRAIRPSSGSAYRLTPAFDFNLEASGNGASGANVLDVRVGNDTLFSVKQNGTVELDGYGAGTINSTTLGTYPTSVAGITANGTLTNYKFARDTFIEDVTLFSVGTLLYDCQELTIVSSMTSLAPTNQEIRFPDAADHLRGKKIIVYSKKKDAGAYVPYISVVGGVSRLFYTTNPAVGGTDPSNQATLYIDDSTWSDHGTTFEFTCLKTDNTPSYRWVLNQR